MNVSPTPNTEAHQKVATRLKEAEAAIAAVPAYREAPRPLLKRARNLRRELERHGYQVSH